MGKRADIETVEVTSSTPAAETPATNPPEAAAPASPAPATAAPAETEAPAKTDEEIRREQMAKGQAAYRERAKAAVGRYRVTLGDESGEYDARDPDEAWAKFCDAHKTWPSPKYSQRKIEKIPEPFGELATV